MGGAPAGTPASTEVVGASSAPFSASLSFRAFAPLTSMANELLSDLDSFGACSISPPLLSFHRASIEIGPRAFGAIDGGFMLVNPSARPEANCRPAAAGRQG